MRGTDASRQHRVRQSCRYIQAGEALKIIDAGSLQPLLGALTLEKLNTTAAAKILGVTSQRVRDFERDGLVSFERDRLGRRLVTREDLLRMRQRLDFITANWRRGRPRVGKPQPIPP